MIILLLVIGFIFGVLGLVISEEHDMLGGFLTIVACIISVVSLIAFPMLIIDVSKSSVIDDKIAMYQEENTTIESQIDELVKNYMSYESGTLSEFKSESSITLVSLYPELKSDTLVQTQITTYTENNNKIKELKEELIMRSVYRWWLYFGK